MEAIAENADQKQRLTQYKEFLGDAVSRGSVEQCKAFVDHLLSDQVPLVMARQLLQHWAAEIRRLLAEDQKALAAYALERLQPRVVSFEEQAAAIRELLAELHVQGEDWTLAAQTLAGIDLDSGMRQLGPDYKLGRYVRIAMLFLEDDDAVSAEQYIKRASALLASCKDEALELQYRSCYARILDAKRRFVEAASRYYELSQAGKRGQKIDDEDLQQSLQAAVTCVVLAPPGPQRSRVLAQLYKDERCARLGLYRFLEKVYMERLLGPEEVEAFSCTLKPHQKALLPGGQGTVLDRAVVEHNLAAAARLYDNVHVASLGQLLGVPPERAERVAARMIAEGSLKGHVDQVAQLVTFGESRQLERWDDSVTGLCSALNSVVDAMAAKGVKFEPEPGTA